MAVREILQLGNPILWEQCAGVEDPCGAEAGAIAVDLSDTLAEFKRVNGFGRGIAAPQIGVARRVIYVRMPGGVFDGALINPSVVWGSPNQVELWDSCFSFQDIMVRVARSARVRVEYSDRQGRRHLLDATGDLSELLQHEIDHLDGVLALDRAVSPRAVATKAEWERMGRPR